MQEIRNDNSPFRRKPFDLQEAVVLLDVYLSVVKNGHSQAEAAVEASKRLRSMAIRNGNAISDSFRSTTGLQNRLRSIGSIYEEKKSRSAPETVAFAEAVALYKNDRDRFDEILCTEQRKANNSEKVKSTERKYKEQEGRRKQMEEKQKAAEQEFFQWLPNNVSPFMLDKIKESYFQINTMLIKTGTLPQMLTSVTLSGQIQDALRQTKKTFASKKFRGTAEKLLGTYLAFLREKEDIVLEAKDKTTPCLEHSASSQGGRGVSIVRAEEYLYSAGLYGATVKEIIDAVQPGAPSSPTIKALDESLNVVSMPGNKYVHVDCFVDFDEAEKELGRILSTHFAQFGSYSNNQLLFGAAMHELSMFLNDNDCESVEDVYAIARFLFEKKAVTGHPYKFYTPHIFEVEPDYPMNLRGLMIHLARSNGGVLLVDEAKDYLQKTMLTYGGMGQLLQIGSSDTFLMYDSERYLLSEKLGIDGAWIHCMHERMDNLFHQADVAYIIPRDINTSWLDTLPPLPQGLCWTHLLLQEVLDKYRDIGFRTILPDLNQTHDTIAAAIVPNNSQLQSFPDVVTLFMEERHLLPMKMAGEDLRIKLRTANMLAGGELIYTLPKALDDYRFAWSNENKTVYVRGN